MLQAVERRLRHQDAARAAAVRARALPSNAAATDATAVTHMAIQQFKEMQTVTIVMQAYTQMHQNSVMD